MGQKQSKTTPSIVPTSEHSPDKPFQIDLVFAGPLTAHTDKFLPNWHPDKFMDYSEWAESREDTLVAVPLKIRMKSSRYFVQNSRFPTNSWFRARGCYVLCYNLSEPAEETSKQLQVWLRDIYRYSTSENNLVLVGVDPDHALEETRLVGEAAAAKFGIEHYIVNIEDQEEIKRTIKLIIEITYLHLSQNRELPFYEIAPTL